MKQLLILTLTLLLYLSCTQPKVEERINQQAIWPNGTMYEIFVQSFADSNGDGIGDFNGMTSKLDYLQDLGIQGIWLMPISPSPSYHKYDVTDYYNVHPDYGTMDDFKRFVAEAHKRNIKVVMDYVVNHSSSEHPWFKSAKSDKNSQYRNYYVWANIDSIQNQLSKKETTLDSDNITQWHKNGDSDQYYYGFFYGGMPDLNYDNPALRAEMIKAGTFWLQEVGIDGFRLDAAKHIFPDEQAKKSHAWWIEFGNAMRKINPEVYLVGEVWGNAELVGPYLKGLPSMFNFDFHHAINNLMRLEKNNGIVDSLIKARSIYRKIQPNYQDAIFVNNHDQNRLISNVGGNNNKNKLAAAILLTLPGTPYIYYGDEIGMLGKKPDEMIREPFLWHYVDKDSLRTKWIEPVNSNDSTVVPLALQIKDSNSTYYFFKAWIKERNKQKILREGELISLPVSVNLLAYKRTQGDESVVILHNLTGTDAELPLSDINCEYIEFYFGQKPKISSGNISIGAYQSVILK
ncbi:MAG: alpha-amylase [Cyclobacteriaceae bacterium]|nr:alpha-amylase [Cyclobacteriaceae bacterium]